MADVRRDSRDANRSYKSAKIQASTSGDNTIVTGVSTKLIKVHAIVLNATGTVNVKFKDGASTDLTGAMNFQAREGYTINVTPPAFLLATSAGNALVLNLSAAVEVDGFLSYWDDDTA